MTSPKDIVLDDARLDRLLEHCKPCIEGGFYEFELGREAREVIPALITELRAAWALINASDLAGYNDDGPLP